MTICVWQILLKKLDSKEGEVEMEVDVTQAYKDDSWYEQVVTNKK